MTLHIDIEPLCAMKLFYGKETYGIWEGDMIKNAKSRNVYLPELLKSFLLKYAYFDVNKGNVHCYHPEEMDVITSKEMDKDTEVEMMVIGRRNEYKVGLLTSAYSEENPSVYFGQLIKEDTLSYWHFEESGLHLRDFLILLFVENLGYMTASEVFDEDEMMASLKKDYEESVISILRDKIANSIKMRHFLCWDDDKKRFLAVVLLYEETLFVSIPQGLTLAELETLFHQEFYTNCVHCDYAHAYQLLQEIIKRMEKEKDSIIALGEKYQLAGRCCWALRQWDDAEEWYKKARQSLQVEIAKVYEKAHSFYFGLGHFYYEKGDKEKSQQAYAEAKNCEKYSGELPRRCGNLFQQQAVQKSEEGAYEEALALYEQALEEYRKDPQDCKYDIARCQQLKGETRRKRKLLKKSDNM